MIAATVAYHVALACGIQYWQFFLESVPAFSLDYLPWVLLGGIAFGLCAILLIESLNFGLRVSLRMNLHPLVKGLLGGLVLLAIAFLLSLKVLGLGGDVIQDTIQGPSGSLVSVFDQNSCHYHYPKFWREWGDHSPDLFLLARPQERFFATIFNLPTDLFAALGLAGLLAGAINTPITAVLVAIELFGLPVGTYALVICAISFLISGHRSAIPTQLLAINKAPAIRTPLQREVSKTHPEIEPLREQLKFYQDVLKRYTSKSQNSENTEPKKERDGVIASMGHLEFFKLPIFPLETLSPTPRNLLSLLEGPRRFPFSFSPKLVQFSLDLWLLRYIQSN